ncbi:MAG: hypothetical protein HY985_02705 [Magnetospirillum sp.]|nr:hypothetical protein [Magnetospirillum sp.]
MKVFLSGTARLLASVSVAVAVAACAATPERGGESQGAIGRFFSEGLAQPSPSVEAEAAAKNDALQRALENFVSDGFSQPPPPEPGPTGQGDDPQDALKNFVSAGFNRPPPPPAEPSFKNPLDWFR